MKEKLFLFNFSKMKKRQHEKETKELTKDEEIKRQIKIMQKRAKEIEFDLVKHEKGEVFEAKIKGLSIGKCIGPRLIGLSPENLKINKFNWRLINRLVERTAPYNSLLYMMD